MVILSQDMIKALRDHRYSSVGTSIFDIAPILRHVADKLPRRLSPNAVTILGLSSVYIACALAIYQSCYRNEEGFRLMAYFCCFAFFMWLICDNLDGVLARVRGVCSPFGEILDHGGDAIGILLSSATISSCFNFQRIHFATFAYILSDVATNYISEPCSIYISGTFHMESIDFNEIMLLFMVISLLTASYGTNIWLYEIFPSIGFQVCYIFYIIKVCIILTLIFGKTFPYFTTVPVKKRQLNVQIRLLVPLVVVLIAASIAYTSSSEDFLQQNVIELSLCFGFSIIKLHIELVIAHMVKMKAKLFNLSLLLPILLAFGIAMTDDPSMERQLTLLFLLAIASDAIVYFLRLLYEIYRAMNVRLCILDDNMNDIKAMN